MRNWCNPIFRSAFEFVSRVPVSRLTFVPDARVWELIRMSKLYVARNPQGGGPQSRRRNDDHVWPRLDPVHAEQDGDHPVAVGGRRHSRSTKSSPHRICSEFDVEPAEALQDAETLARELASHEILQISEEPIPQQNPSGRRIPMNGLLEEMTEKALKLNIPLSVQARLDLSLQRTLRALLSRS